MRTLEQSMTSFFFSSGDDTQIFAVYSGFKYSTDTDMYIGMKFA